MNDTTRNSAFRCPRCGKKVDLTEASVYVSDHTDTNVAGRYIRTSNYTQHEIMCKGCAFYRNRAESFFKVLIWVLAVIISVVLVAVSYMFSFVNGGIIARIIYSVLIGTIAGFFLAEFLKYCFYAYDNIKMFFVRRKNR
jgi:hypothetical protein